MLTQNKKARILLKVAFIAAIFNFSAVSQASNLSPLIDDFSDPTINSLGIPRQFMNDTVAGGGTTSQQQVSNGVLHVSGEITPPRGQPGWASTVLPLDMKGLPKDASQYQGIRLVIRINTGNLSISANSAEVTNFDYHASPVAVVSDGKFHEVKIPFNSMKRAWSEQTQLDPKTINGLSIVAFGLQKGAFSFELDEVGFYSSN